MPHPLRPYGNRHSIGTDEEINRGGRGRHRPSCLSRLAAPTPGVGVGNEAAGTSRPDGHAAGAAPCR
eukprot:9423000-Lingulodinium_polyedra.AAC.1